MTDTTLKISEDFEFTDHSEPDAYTCHESRRKSDPSWRSIMAHRPEGNFRFNIAKTARYHVTSLMALRVERVEIVRPEPGDSVTIRLVDNYGAEMDVYIVGPDAMAKLHTAVEVASEKIAEARA